MQIVQYQQRAYWGGDSAVWVLSEDLGTVTRINPATSAVAAQIDVGSGFGTLGLANGAVWVVNHNDSVVKRIDPGSNRVVLAITPGS